MFSDDDFVSFMLATKDGYLTNAGLLLSDNPPFISCRLFATKWNGLDKVNEDEVDDDKEFGGSILRQLDDAILYNVRSCDDYGTTKHQSWILSNLTASRLYP